MSLMTAKQRVHPIRIRRSSTRLPARPGPAELAAGPGSRPLTPSKSPVARTIFEPLSCAIKATTSIVESESLLQYSSYRYMISSLPVANGPFDRTLPPHQALDPKLQDILEYCVPSQQGLASRVRGHGAEGAKLPTRLLGYSPARLLSLSTRSFRPPIFPLHAWGHTRGGSATLERRHGRRQQPAGRGRWLPHSGKHYITDPQPTRNSPTHNRASASSAMKAHD